MVAVAINNRSSTYELIQQAAEFVLSVPGPSLVDETMYCGVQSMQDVDKIKHLALDLVESETVSVPGLRRAIANVELRKFSSLEVGDHLLVVGEVRRFAVNVQSSELPLLSIGPYTKGYELLRKKGIHRLGVVARQESNDD
jgi:flavin reductase (DIM6/NTAB) family NADH-FMN oxidoreductase RutF